MLGLTIGCAAATTTSSIRYRSAISTRSRRSLPAYCSKERLFAVRGRQRGGRHAANSRHKARQAPPVNPRRNEEYFSATPAGAVRFTILASNDGAEPCLDELEIYRARARTRRATSPCHRPAAWQVPREILLAILATSWDISTTANMATTKAGSPASGVVAGCRSICGKW